MIRTHKLGFGLAVISMGVAIFAAFCFGIGVSGKINAGRDFNTSLHQVFTASGRADAGRYGRIYEGIVREQVSRSHQFSGAVAVIGDSNTFGLATSNLGVPAENFGINCDGIDGVLYRLPRYDLRGVRTVVLAIGTNDWGLKFAKFGEKYRRALALIPSEIPVVASAIPPVNEARLSRIQYSTGRNAAILKANAAIQEACAARPHCVFSALPNGFYSATGGLAEVGDSGDGIHFSSAGYALWTKSLSGALHARQ